MLPNGLGTGSVKNLTLSRAPNVPRSMQLNSHHARWNLAKVRAFDTAPRTPYRHRSGDWLSYQ